MIQHTHQANIEAAARALARHELTSNGADPAADDFDHTVESLWSIPAARERFMAQAGAALEGAHQAQWQRATARIGEEVPADTMVSDDAVLAQVCARHGMSAPSAPDAINGDLQHLISPVVGMLRMEATDPHRTERLSLALALLRRQQQATERSRNAR